MKKIIVSLFLFCFYIGIGQNTDRKFDIGLHYPLSTGENFMVFAYDGLIGLDIRYQFVDTRLISPKLGFSVDYFNYNFVDNLNGHAFVLKPKLIGEFNIQSMAQFKPYVSLGYSVFTTAVDAANGNLVFDGSDASFQPNDDRFTDSQSGINWGFGAAYDLTEKFFIEVSADFIKLDLKGNTSGNWYNENIHTVNMGVGVRF